MKKTSKIKEQTIKDKASGLTLKFLVFKSGGWKLRVAGAGLPFANRDFFFDHDGTPNGTGTSLRRRCRLCGSETREPEALPA